MSMTQDKPTNPSRRAALALGAVAWSAGFFRELIRPYRNVAMR